MAIKIGRWDCTQCGHLGNPGPLTRCEKCGASRPENVVFYLADNAETVNNSNKIKETKSGADWICSFCSTHNKVSQTVCQSCGNDRDATDGDESLKEKVHLFNQKPKPEKKPFRLGKGFKRILIAIASFFVLFFFLALFTSDIDVTVNGFKWERSIEIEEYKKVIEEDWRLPEGAEKINSYQAVHHNNQIADGTETKTRTVQKQVGTEQVKIGEKDLGNGYFEDIYEDRAVYEDVEESYEVTKYKQIPVYKTKYKYSVFRWKDVGTIEASDTKKPAYWPEDVRLDDTSKFRVKKRNEKYFLLLDYDGKINTVALDFKLWESTNIGDILKAEKSTVFGTFIGLKKSEN